MNFPRLALLIVHTFDVMMGMANGGLSSETCVMDTLDTSLDELNAGFLTSLNRKELAERSLRLLTARDRLDAALATTIAEAERACIPALGKQRTMAQYLASRSHCAPEIVRADLRAGMWVSCLLYTSPSPRDKRQSRMPSSA